MKNENSASGGNAPTIVDRHVVALYEPNTGEIRHIHTVTVFAGGGAVDEEEAIQRALDTAEKAGHKTQHLAVKVSKIAEHGCRPHRIDPVTKEFVALEMNRPVRRRGAGLQP